MVGGLFYHNYCSGTGLMSGATFGRLAGRNAAEFAGGAT
jgi:tricarballylate dehydrogenase